MQVEAIAVVKRRQRNNILDHIISVGFTHVCHNNFADYFDIGSISNRLLVIA